MKISISTIKRIIKEEVDSATKKDANPNAPSPQMQAIIEKLIQAPIFQKLQAALEKVTSVEMKSKIINDLMSKLDPEMDKGKIASKVKTLSGAQQKSRGGI
jgi:hypothetical protein